MTNFDKIKMMNEDELVTWLDSLGWEDTPWANWWNDTYCSKCEPEFVKFKDCNFEVPCGWCEIHKKCKYFQELDETPNSAEVIKMWLEVEVIE